MNVIKTILVPFDFSEASKTALDYAVNFSGSEEDMKIILTHVTKDSDQEKVERDLKGNAGTYPNFRGSIAWKISDGSLIDAILKIRKTEKVDLVIMGTSGSKEKEEDESTNTSKLVHEIECPVLAIPLNTKKFSLQRIALVMGQEEIEDNSELATLLDLARRFDAKVHVLTIKNKPGLYGYSEIDEKNEKNLEYYLESFYSEHSFVENPDVVEGIFDYASKENIDMVAILPRNHAKNSTPSKGRLTRDLTLRSQIPILAID